MQPGRNLSFSAKSPQISERRKKCLLCRVACVFFAPKHAEGEREYPALPAMHNLAESLSITCQSALYDLLVARSDFHSLSSDGHFRRPVSKSSADKALRSVV